MSQHHHHASKHGALKQQATEEGNSKNPSRKAPAALTKKSPSVERITTSAKVIDLTPSDNNSMSRSPISQLAEIQCPVPGCPSRPFTRCQNPTKALKTHIFNKGYAGDMEHEKTYKCMLDEERFTRGRHRALAAVKLSGEPYTSELIDSMARDYVKAMYAGVDWTAGMVGDELYGDDDDYLLLGLL